MFQSLKRSFLCRFLSVSAILLSNITPVFALPQGGSVAGGQATITTPSATQLDVTQSTNRAIINWNSFNINSNEKVDFIQPSSQSITLNRVTGGGSASQILGQLNANGNVWIVNSQGVVFGQGAQVNVGGLLASSSDISNNNFMNGNYAFTNPGNPNATISNAGDIKVADGSLAALVGPNVTNSGLIQAKLGKVQLASGDSFTVDLYGDGLLNLQASPQISKQLVANSGKIVANGGTVLLTTAAAETTINSLINMSGVIEANSIGHKNGHVVLYAAGSNAVPGNVTGNKGVANGTSTVLVSGTISAQGKKNGQTGGTVTATADNVGILSGASINASGASGGGTLQIGGDFHGQGATPTALNTVVQSNTILAVNATNNGNGGKVTVWSDGSTDFAGTIQAKGGPNGGNGGFVETSGENLNTTGTVNTTAANGLTGTLLLDPYNVIISNGTDSGDCSLSGTCTPVANTSIVNSGLLFGLLGTTSVTINTNTGAGGQAGNITVTNGVNWNSVNGLTLTADGAITISGGSGGLVNGGTGNISLSAVKGITIKDVVSTGGSLVLSNSGTTGSINASTGALTATGASFTAALSAAGAITVSNAGNNLTGTITFDTPGGVVLANKNGAIVAVGGAGIGGNLSVTNATGGNITQSGALVVGGTTTITNNGSGGTIVLTDSGNKLTGTIKLKTTGASADATVANSVATKLGASTTGGNLTVEADALNITGAVNVNGGAGTMTVKPLTSGTQLSLQGASALNLDQTDLDHITAGTFVFGNATAGDLTVNGKVKLASTNITNMVLQTGGNIVLNNAVIGASGGNLTLVGNTLTNTEGFDALQTTGGVWLVYLPNPADLLLAGNLNSNNTAVWDTTYPTGVSLAGNRYVFANQPTVTFNATSLTKIYGTDNTSTVASDSNTISGLQPGVTGAYLADTVSSVFTGTPTFSSLGSAATANVNGGTPYAITVSGVTPISGYAVAATGTVTVNPATLTISAVNNTKTYDGTTTSSATPTYIGLAAVDAGNLTSLVQNFNSPNVATPTALNGRTLSVTGYSLTDPGNYTVVLQTALGTINPASLTLAAVTDTKTYDGTTTSTATPQIVGTLYVNSGSGQDSVTNLSQDFNSPNVATPTALNGRTLSVNGYTVHDGNGGANYTISTTTALGTINPASLTLAAVTDTKTYDGTTTSTATPQIVGTLYVNSGSGQDSVTNLSQDFNSPNVATPTALNGRTLSVNGYTVHDGNGGANYTISTTTALGTINPASLIILANNQSMPLGGPLPVLTFDATGFQASDTASTVLTGGLATNAFVHSLPGLYDITQGTLTSNPNYTIAYTPATLVVGNASSSVDSTQEQSHFHLHVANGGPNGTLLALALPSHGNPLANLAPAAGGTPPLNFVNMSPSELSNLAPASGGPGMNAIVSLLECNSETPCGLNQ